MKDCELSEEREIAYRRLEAELQLFWQRNNYAWLIFLGSVSALGYLFLELIKSDKAGGVGSHQLFFMIQVATGFSTLAMAFWLNMIRGGRYWIREWEVKIKHLEKQMPRYLNAKHNEHKDGLYHERGLRAFSDSLFSWNPKHLFREGMKKSPGFYRSNVVSVTASLAIVATMSFVSIVLWSIRLLCASWQQQWYQFGENHLESCVVNGLQILLTGLSLAVVSGYTWNLGDLSDTQDGNNAGNNTGDNEVTTDPDSTLPRNPDKVGTRVLPDKSNN